MRLFTTALAASLLVACGSAKDYGHNGDNADGYWDSGGYAEDGDWEADADADTDSDSDTDDLPSEEEDGFFGMAPAPAPTFVFVANPDRDTVTRIGVPELDVLTAPVGDMPEWVTTTPDYLYAVTYNGGSEDLSILPSDTLEETRVELRPNLDTVELSPDGAWAVAYNAIGVEDEGSNAGATSVKEASFVHVTSASHTAMALGFQPRDVAFTEDAATAVVLGDAWLGVVDLTADPLGIELVEIGDEVDPPQTEELVLDPAGNYALLRQRDAAKLVLVDLVDLSALDIPVGSGPTDLDLTPDGTKAIAVARGAGELWLYDLADPTAEPEVIPTPASEVLGSIAFTSEEGPALLFSTATGVSRFTSWDPATGEFDLHPLPKPVKSVGVDPTGQTALVLHDEEDSADMDPSYEGLHGVTMVELSSFRANDYALPAEPIGFAHSDDGAHGYFIMEGEGFLEVLDYSSLLIDEVELKSDPVFVGTLPDTNWAYASQEHDLGRISFYDPDTDELKTITGFELNAGIEEE